MNIILQITKLHKAFLLVLLIGLSSLLACSGGSDDNDSGGGLSTNACGVVGLNSRIINGTECTETQNSGIVRVIIDNGQGLCSGTMITPTQVLTASHCFDSGTQSASIIIGDNVLNGTRIFATSVARHPAFSSSASNNFDVAILNLERAANLATLPIVIGRSAIEGEVASIFGFGQDEDDGNPTAALMSGEMRISGVSELQIAANFSGEGSNTCFGDSGGPLIIANNQRVGIAGVLSFGTTDDCLAGDTSVFTNLQAAGVLQFITQIAPAAEFI